MHSVTDHSPVVPVGIGCHVAGAIIVLSLHSGDNSHTSENDGLACGRHGFLSKLGKVNVEGEEEDEGSGTVVDGQERKKRSARVSSKNKAVRRDCLSLLGRKKR